MQIDFATTSVPGAIPQEGNGRLVNALVEKLGADKVKFIRSPGVARYYTPPPGDNTVGFRGMAFLNNTLWIAYQDKLYYTQTSTGGLLTQVPAAPTSLAGTDPVFFAANQRTTAGVPTPDIVAVKQSGGAFVVTTTSITSYSSVDVDLPNATCVDVCYGLGFFFFAINDGRCFSSAINGTAIASSDVIIAQAKPDGLFRCLFFQDQLYLCGPDSIEVWGKPINATAFPLNRITVVPRGIVNPRCVTCFENGFDLGLVILSSNNEVMRLNGFQPERISEPDLERAVARLPDKSTIEMTSFNAAGHMYLKVKSPSWCWMYDFTTQTWHERNSWLSITSRLKQTVFVEFAGAMLTWMVGDESTSDIGRISSTTYDEFNSPLTWAMDSKPVQGFPSRVVVGPAHFEFVPGTGNFDQPTVTMAGASAPGAAQLIITTGPLHNLVANDTVFFSGVVGMQIGSVTQMNGRQGLVKAPITPTSFRLTDLNGVDINTTGWTIYASGGTIRRQNVPHSQSNPTVEISWSDDGGLNYKPSQARDLGVQGNSTLLIRTYLTGSITPYGRIWRLKVSDPVYVSFAGGDMPRIGRRAAA